MLNVLHHSPASHAAPVLHVERQEKHSQDIVRQLKLLGAVRYDFLIPEIRALNTILAPDETVTGIVFGRYHQVQDKLIGRGALVATKNRILLVDKKPLFIRCDEISHDVVSGVKYTKAGFAGTITLHSRVGDIKMRTFNQACARSFVAAIEQIIYEHKANRLEA